MTPTLKSLILTAALCALAAAVHALGPEPDQTILWNRFYDVTVVDSWVLAMAPEGIVVMQLDDTDSTFVQVDQLLFDDEPVQMKRQDDLLLVGTMHDSLILVDLTGLPQLQRKGGVDVGLPVSDFARHGDDLYASAWFSGILRFTIGNDNRISFADSSMKPILVTQLEVSGDTLYGLDEYNGLFRYDLSGDGFGRFVDYLFIPVRAYAFLQNNDEFLIAGLNEGIMFGEFGHTGSGIFDALGDIQPVRRILTTGDRFVFIGDRVVELVDRNDYQQRLTVDIGDDIPEGDLFYIDGAPFLLLPGQFGGLVLYQLDGSGRSLAAYDRPGPITGLLLNNGRLYTGGAANPVDVYRLESWRPTPKLDFTIYSSLRDVVSIGRNGDSLIVLYDDLSKIAFISSAGDADDYYLESSIFVDDYNAFRIDFVDSWFEQRPAVMMYTSSSISVYPINDSNIVEYGATWSIIGGVLAATFSDSLLVVSTGKNAINFYHINPDYSLTLTSSLALATPAYELTMLDGRLVYFTHDRMIYVDISDPYQPRIETTQPLLVPVTDGVRLGDRLYTVGERGVAVYDLNTSPPVLIDHGGRPGSFLATDGQTLATSNGESIHIYYLHEDRMMHVNTAASLPERFELPQNYPNPFNPVTFIDFNLPQAAQVKLDVFNLLGQMVTTLVDEPRPAGYHTVSWNGVDASGAPVASGVYIYRLTADDFHASNKMVLIR